MSDPKKIIQTEESLCRECLACVRACPVKAIKMVGGHAEVLEEKCIFCSLCVEACSQGAKTVESDIDKVLDLLKTKQVAAIVASEIVASFYPRSLSQIKAGLAKLDFVTIEDTTLAEEIVAEQYVKLCRESSCFPIIRSSCPVVVEFILKYYPQFAPHLAPTASPMVIQGRLVKAMYPGEVATVYITPCPARKVEADEETADGAIDTVLTFEELKVILARERMDLSSVERGYSEGDKPFLKRTVSVTGGFPREIVASRTLMDRDVSIVRGVCSLGELMDAISRGEVRPRLVDALSCNSCAEGPAIDCKLNVYERKNVIEKAYQEQADRSRTQITYNDIYRVLPAIETGRSFPSREISLALPSEAELEGILASAEKNNQEEVLNCGACGYDSCRDAAVAVYQGLTEWSSCLPFQRKMFMKVINQLKENAITDGLTQLANHRYFSERLAIEFKRAKRYDSWLSLMMMDIDFFKLVNDTYGHLKGDEVLVNIARIIRENVRESDLPARYGGDEFALILPETDGEQAYAVAEKLRKRVEKYIFTLDDLDMLAKLTISVGVATLTTDIKDVPGLVEKADKALYAAKQDGRNKTSVAADSVG